MLEFILKIVNSFQSSKILIPKLLLSKTELFSLYSESTTTNTGDNDNNNNMTKRGEFANH